MSGHETRNFQDPNDLAKMLAALPPAKRALLELELKKRNAGAVATNVRQPQQKQTQTYLGKLQPGQGKGSVFCFLFSGGFQMEVSTFSNLARLVGRDYSFYAVIARGTDGISKPHHRIEDMAAAYIQDIVSVEPSGPYFLVGECLSAPVAYETARQLRLQGKPVGLLALLGASARRPWFYQYLGTWLGAHVRFYRNQWFQNTNPDVIALQSRQIRRAQKAYSLAIFRYRPRPYEGRIVVIANEETCAADPTLGWHSPGGLEVHQVPGNHENYLRDHPDRVADIVRLYLDQSTGRLGVGDGDENS
jgi:surfactin synthase thioesterase subunit